MQHKISALCDKVTVIYAKSEQLRNLKYNVPKEQQDKTQIDFLVADIQTLCREVGYDRDPYSK
jgi:hypothetical protein